MTIFSKLTDISGWKWKLAAGAAAVSLITVSGLYVYAQLENRHLSKVNSELTASIDDPTTGFRARLATETANRANLEAAVEVQNEAITKQAAESSARLKDTATKLEAAQRATRRAEAQVAVLLATPPKGNTLAERIADVDARVLETLE